MHEELTNLRIYTAIFILKSNLIVMQKGVREEKTDSILRKRLYRSLT